MTRPAEIIDPAAWDESIRLYAIANGHRDAGRVDLANEWQAEAVRAWMRALGRDTTPRAANVSPDVRAAPAGSGEIFPGRAAAVGERGVASTAALIGDAP